MEQNKKFISICIPTYNRAPDLKKNLALLERQILRHQLNDDVCIVVSDNASTDNTKDILENFQDNSSVDIFVIYQNHNTGAEKNQLLVGEAASSDYIMLLGDDDYLHDNYLIEVYNVLKLDPSISCIIPDFQGVTPNGKVLFNRDMNGERKIFSPGFESCLKNSWRAHQLSGLTFRKQNHYETYKLRRLNNLYPQIFLISISCLNGKCLYMPEYPVNVTQVPQKNKDWCYGKDGLIIDNFDNYVHLRLKKSEVGKLEICILKKSIGGILAYPSILDTMKAMHLIFNDAKTVAPTKLFCFWYFPYLLLRNIVSRIILKKK